MINKLQNFRCSPTNPRIVSYHLFDITGKERIMHNSDTPCESDSSSREKLFNLVFYLCETLVEKPFIYERKLPFGTGNEKWFI